MFLFAHHVQRALIYSLLLWMMSTVMTRSSQTADLKSKISGVEELLEEFRKQLQQDGSDSREDEEYGDGCVSGFRSVEERIIRASASIEQGAAFLSAPQRVFSWRDCVHVCCSHPHCTTAIIQEDLKQPDESLRCYLFNCSYRGRNVCSFSFQPGFSSYSWANDSSGPHEPTRSPESTDQPNTPARGPSNEMDQENSLMQGLDEPPRSDAGQDLVVQLPTDWAVLDGRDSTDDHDITHYEWTLVKGDPSVNMKVTHQGLLKLSGLREGVYTFQMTVTDTAGQKSSDNVSVSVLAPAPNAEVCTGHCSRYQFMCDDGCCIDIGYACDGKQHCPDRSDEDFCQNSDTGHMSSPPSKHRPDIQTEKAAQKPAEIQISDIPHKPEQHQHYGIGIQDLCAAPPVVGPCKGVFPRWYYESAAGECLHFLYGGCKGNHNNFLQKSDCVNECIQTPSVTKQQISAAPSPSMKTYTSPFAAVYKGKMQYPLIDSENSLLSKAHHMLEGHPPPESGAILPLTLGLIISALLLLMVVCRLWLVRRRLKKALPLTTEESDYLINGMYL
ncbi:low-density lipoprotein receptor-related protein 11 [Xyrauchen texanus]|uniref:low-density lipoprotein receptor-related protein 11 n=1 Tax=Xyrauchen texanus TaxID=154827 RepID=UPI002242BD26|nr:low-density lipoprotein receptor-related protein 11 [Xyrauchen texanus]